MKQQQKNWEQFGLEWFVAVCILVVIITITCFNQGKKDDPLFVEELFLSSSLKDNSKKVDSVDYQYPEAEIFLEELIEEN